MIHVYILTRQEKSTVIIEHLVLAMNAVVRFSSTNGRKQVCRLGEEVFVNILFLLTHRPTVRLKVSFSCFFMYPYYSRYGLFFLL